MHTSNKILISHCNLTSSIVYDNLDTIYLGKHKINAKSWTRKLKREDVLRSRRRT